MKEFIPIRLSHLLAHCSVGAVFSGPIYLMTAKDTREWTDRDGNPAGRRILYVERVRKTLGIAEELWEPPVAHERDKAKGLVDGVCIPAIRFPFWMRCPSCGLLYYKPWNNGDGSSKPFCKECREREQRTYTLIQVTSIMVNQDGYMADVPWHRLAHIRPRNRSEADCKSDSRVPYLCLKESDKKFSSWDLRCGRCGAKETFKDGGDEKILYGKFPMQPWLKNGTGEQTDERILGEIISVTDTRVHFHQLKTALIIPPESRVRKGTVVDYVYSSSESRRQIENARYPLARKQQFRQLATRLRCLPAEVEAAWEAIENKSYPPDIGDMTPGQLMEDEYKALVNEIPDLQDDEDFVTHHKTSEWKELAQCLSPDSKNLPILACFNRLVAVNRLKEIRILKGFKRISDTARCVPPDIDGLTKRLPAIELFGEGIFLTLDEAILSSWEQLPAVQKRADIFRARFERSGMKFETEIEITPRLILLHTLSHILIRQLEADAGYTAASLKERIYSKTGSESMAGILIYVAVPDIVGSLGGLVEQSHPRRMLALLSSVFDHAL